MSLIINFIIYNCWNKIFRKCDYVFLAHNLLRLNIQKWIYFFWYLQYIILRIFLFYSVFLAAVERCLTRPHELGKLFKKYERKLLMYVVYCQNKPVSEYLVSDHNDYFEVTYFINKLAYLYTLERYVDYRCV